MVEALKGKEWQRVEVISTPDKSGYVRRLISIGASVVKGAIVAEVVELNGIGKHPMTSPENGVMFIWQDDPRGLPGTVAGIVLKAKD